jgi:hypothetical protein
MSTLWKSRYALRTLGIKSSPIREILSVSTHADFPAAIVPIQRRNV